MCAGQLRAIRARGDLGNTSPGGSQPGRAVTVWPAPACSQPAATSSPPAAAAAGCHPSANMRADRGSVQHHSLTVCSGGSPSGGSRQQALALLLHSLNTPPPSPSAPAAPPAAAPGSEPQHKHASSGTITPFIKHSPSLTVCSGGSSSGGSRQYEWCLQSQVSQGSRRAGSSSAEGEGGRKEGGRRGYSGAACGIYAHAAQHLQVAGVPFIRARMWSRECCPCAICPQQQ